MEIVKGLKPESFWKHFYNLTRIPRKSGNEEGVRKYAASFAEEHKLDYKIDAIGNIIIRRPASPGKENSPSVVLQGHMDMVCEKNRDYEHDFSKDPIKLKIEDGWLKAEGTTLGADNGVAVAAGLAVLESDEALGPVEVLLTVDEETGLTGAMELDPSIVESRILINLDSEEDGVVYVGCAGGKNTDGYIPVAFEAAPSGYKAYKLVITGLKGGHSGGEIHLQLGNSIQFGSRFLYEAGKLFDLRFSSVEGGGTHNVIPREFFADLLVAEADAASFEAYAAGYQETIRSEYSLNEPNLSITVSACDAADKAFAEVYTEESQQRVVNLLYSLPHGVVKMSQVLDNLVQTSTNLATVQLQENSELFVENCSRSSVDSECDDIAARAAAAMEAAGGRVVYMHDYPGWNPDPESQIRKIAEKVYKDVFGRDVEIKAIHAGLECGVIGEKFDSLDMISFGPELSDVHTPGEKMEINSVEKCWKFLIAILKML